MLKTLTAGALLAATTALASPSSAAMQFTAMPIASGQFVLDMSGEISQGDTVAAAKFVKQHMITAPGDRLVGYDLYSPGGSIGEAELMAAAIKKSNLPTAVDTLCVSACFLPFAAGSQKIVATTAKIGVHSTSDQGGIETVSTAAATTMMARDYADLGVPAAIIGKMVATPPGQVTWLTADDLRTMNVKLYTPPPVVTPPATTGVPAMGPAQLPEVPDLTGGLSTSSSTPVMVPSSAPAPPAPMPTTVAPPATAPAPPSRPAPAPTDPTQAFEQGHTERRAYEAWIAAIPEGSQFKEGAVYWASVRSTKKAAIGCVGPGYTGTAEQKEWAAGCLSAKAKLDPTDYRRLTNAYYRDGWNSVPDMANDVSPRTGPVAYRAVGQ